MFKAHRLLYHSTLGLSVIKKKKKKKSKASGLRMRRESNHLRVVHLGRSTYHTISGRGDYSTRIHHR